MRSALSTLLAVLYRAALAQEPAPPDLIDHLVANATQYAATLPSISATETIDSQGSYSIFHRHVRAQGIMRVVRNAATGEIDESRHITEVDGKPITPGHNPGLPWTLTGGFGKFQELFFTAGHRACYTFTLLPQPGPAGTLQIAIAELPLEQRTPACPSRDFTGLARVDPITRHIVYMERTTSDAMALRYHLAPFASVEAAPAKVGDEIFWLPTVVVGTFVSGKVKGRFEAKYSDYHRYTGSITILPGATELEPPPAPAKPPPPR